MSQLLLVTCLLALCNNLNGALQFKLNNAGSLNYAKHGKQGQDEYYVPAYFNPLHSNRYMGEDIAESDLLEQDPVDNLVITSPYSRFPSLINPGISIDGPSSLNKYKNLKESSESREPTLNDEVYVSNDDLRHLLASFRNIQPSLNERIETVANYLRMTPNQDRQPNYQPAELASPQQQQQQPHHFQSYSKSPASVDDFTRYSSFRQKWPVFKAENMANPYGQIKLNADKKNKNKEGEVNRKIEKYNSALIQSSKNVANAPKLYQQSIEPDNRKDSLLNSMSDVYFVAIVACVSSVAIFSVIGAGYCFYKVQQSNKAAADVEFPAYGVVGPVGRPDGANLKCTSPPSDRKLTQSAQMYHYHHQKQQMISNEKNANIPRNNAGSDIESDDENEDGEYTVYECPGLAPTGEMEVKNPLFQDDLTPISSPSVNGSSVSKQDSLKTTGNVVSTTTAVTTSAPNTGKSTKTEKQ